MRTGSGTRWTAALAAVLLLLLASLAALQLRWIDAWSTSEEARLGHFVSSGTGRVALDLDRALRELEDGFRDVSGVAQDELPQALLARAQAALESAGALERVVWLDPRRPGEPREVRPAEGRVAPFEWTDELADWERAARALGAAAPASVVRLPAAPPGLLVPLLPGGAGDGLHFALLLLDPVRLAEELSALVEQHLGQAFGDDVRVLVTHGGRTVYGSHAGRAPHDLLDADAARVLGGGRLEIGRGAAGRELVLERGEAVDSIVKIEIETTMRASGSGPEAAARRAPFAVELPAWEVRARHARGSVAAAVAAVRRRNLALGLGILGVLACAALLLLFAARRSRALARRQVEFVAGVTHELRTPLTVIRSAAENLRDSVVTSPDDARRYGSLIHDEARRLTDFVERALSLAGARASAPPRPVELAPLIERAIERCRSGSEDAAAVGLELPPDVPAVLVDPHALEQALENLLANALKYGGEPPEVGVRVAVDAGRVDVVVWDRGPGIPAEERAHLFEPFFRGRRARASQAPGSGLGLAVARRAIEAQGGTISVESENGAGSAFTLHLRAAGA